MPRLGTWTLCLIPSVLMSAWLFLWLEWYLPGENSWGADT